MHAKLTTARAHRSPLVAIVSLTLWSTARQGGRSGSPPRKKRATAKAVIPPYGLNLLNGGPADQIPSAIAPSILRKQERGRLCHL